MCDFAEVRDALVYALSRLYEADSHLLLKDVNERSITHCLAMHVRERFPENWDVDCEYNRSGRERKRLPIDPVLVSSDDTTGKTVYPDIIVHHRGQTGRGANLLVVEAKKAWAAGNFDDDRSKLVAFGCSEDFLYQFGAFLVLGKGGCQVEWYREGVATGEVEWIGQDRTEVQS